MLAQKGNYLSWDLTPGQRTISRWWESWPFSGMSPVICCSIQSSQPWNHIHTKNKSELNRLYLYISIYRSGGLGRAGMKKGMGETEVIKNKYMKVFWWDWWNRIRLKYRYLWKFTFTRPHEQTGNTTYPFLITVFKGLTRNNLREEGFVCAQIHEGNVGACAPSSGRGLQSALLHLG